MKIRYTHWCSGDVCIRAEAQGFYTMRMLQRQDIHSPMAVRYAYRLLRRELRRYLKVTP